MTAPGQNGVMTRICPSKTDRESPMFILFQKILPQHLLSRFVGLLAKTSFAPMRWIFIKVFVYWFKVDLSEAERERQQDYDSFNDFFTRKLKEGARPLDANPEGWISPADGVISNCGELESGLFIQAKNHQYSVSRLMADETMARSYSRGSFATIYLSPKDYHRVHMPCDASLHQYTYVPGKLFSVNQQTSNSIDQLFALNERLICHFTTVSGPMTLIMVGALIVAAIKPVWQDDCFKVRTQLSEKLSTPLKFSKGDELGSFLLGSTVILLTPEIRHWQVAPLQNVRMGQALD